MALNIIRKLAWDMLFIPNDGKSLEEVIKCADSRMYEIKKHKNI